MERGVRLTPNCQPWLSFTFPRAGNLSLAFLTAERKRESHWGHCRRRVKRNPSHRSAIWTSDNKNSRWMGGNLQVSLNDKGEGTTSLSSLFPEIREKGWETIYVGPSCFYLMSPLYFITCCPCSLGCSAKLFRLTISDTRITQSTLSHGPRPFHWRERWEPRGPSHPHW